MSRMGLVAGTWKGCVAGCEGLGEEVGEERVGGWGGGLCLREKEKGGDGDLRYSRIGMLDVVAGWLN